MGGRGRAKEVRRGDGEGGWRRQGARPWSIDARLVTGASAMVVVSNVLYCRFARGMRQIGTECVSKIKTKIFSVWTEGVFAFSRDLASTKRAAPWLGENATSTADRASAARPVPLPQSCSPYRYPSCCRLSSAHGYRPPRPFRSVFPSAGPTSLSSPLYQGHPYCCRSFAAPAEPASISCSPAHPGYCWRGSSLHYPPARGGLSSLRWPGHPSFPRRPLRPPLWQTKPPPMPNGGSPPVAPGWHLR